MEIISVDHIQLAMPAGREADAVAFYCDLLGIPEVAKPPLQASRGGVWFESAGIKIHLGVDPDFRPARKAHVALIVEDLAELIRLLDKAGYKVVDGERSDSRRRVYVYDPFGNRLEFIDRA